MMGGYFSPYPVDPLPTEPRRWRAPLCRTDDRHPEVDHNWDSLRKLGKVCACACHRPITATGQTGSSPDENGRSTDV